MISLPHADHMTPLQGRQRVPVRRRQPSVERPPPKVRIPRTSRQDWRPLTMVDLTVLPGYVAVILLFLGPPGPDMAYMLAVGLEGGRLSAVKAILASRPA